MHRYYGPCSIALAICIASAVLSTPVRSQSARAPTIVLAGGVHLSLPAVTGFRIPDGDERQVMNFIRAGVPPQHRLLALFLSEDDLRRFAAGDLPRLDQYYVAQIPKRAEGMSLTISDFQSVRRSMKDDHSMAMRAHTASQRDFVDSLMRGGTSVINGAAVMRSAEPLALGVFEDYQHAVGVNYLTLERDGHDGAGRMLLTTSVATVLRGRLVFLDGACATRTADDVSRCRHQMKEWVEVLHAANP